MRAILALGQLAPKNQKGEKNGNSKITAVQVKEIRDLYATGTLSQEAIGKKYGIIQNMVIKIVLRRAWRDVA